MMIIGTMVEFREVVVVFSMTALIKNGKIVKEMKPSSVFYEIFGFTGDFVDASFRKVMVLLLIMGLAQKPMLKI